MKKSTMITLALAGTVPVAAAGIVALPHGRSCTPPVEGAQALQPVAAGACTSGSGRSGGVGWFWSSGSHSGGSGGEQGSSTTRGGFGSTASAHGGGGGE